MNEMHHSATVDGPALPGVRASQVMRAGDQRDIGRQQLSASVALHLREQIISGRLQRGTFLRIEAIAREMDVSTTPVREGLLLLQNESFVRLMPRRGFVVNSFTQNDLRDLFWAQATIGAELAERATTRMSTLDFERLGDINARHEQAAADQDQEAATRLGHQFHRTINLAAQAPRLALLLGGLTKQLPNRFYASIEGQLQDAVSYHPIIMQAMQVRDAGAARSLMFRHLVSGADDLIAMLERQGIWAGPDQQRWMDEAQGEGSTG